MVSAPPTVTILQRYSWDEFIEKLRQVTLLGDPSVKPYAEAEITSETLTTDEFAPLAKYVLKQNLATQHTLRSAFQTQYNIDIFHLNGGEPTVAFKVADEKGVWLMSPPIIEESVADDKKLVLLDGEHRCYSARQVDSPVTAIVIRKVNRNCPVVAFPLRWQDVNEYDQVPSLAEKRNFRFPDIRDFPDVSKFSDAEVTPDNFSYFFYRDLSGVCSSGVRAVGSG